MPILDRNYNPAIGSVGGKYAVTDFDTTGASSGQSPIYNGTTVAWGSPGAFTLPSTETDATSTTGTSLSIVESTLTSGTGLKVTGTTAVFTTGGALFKADLSAATAGNGFSAITTGVYTGTGLSLITANSATTGTLDSISGTGLTSGIGQKVTAAAATLTTGRYYSANDSATEVFGVGANGHIHSTVSAAPPTIAVSIQNGITAAAITAGGSDTCGIITTTGTNNAGGATVLQVTFGKTYTAAPKGVILMPANASGAKAADTSGAGVYISAVAATTFDITIPSDAGAGATPSFRYVVIA